ncbi:MAG: hypothetical protein CMJ01_00165 [Pelagibacteraceae bacterium]|nr:hypothetical protein [Pelagibacteraceae bacterium]|tara:strand:+ start:32255 stop:33295 length:1041 start_codon:yes stop_codon:yes gene_type:complete
MKNIKFILCILIILLKTGNVLSDNNIFNVNNIEIDKKISKNKEKTTNLAFQKGFKKLASRLLLEEDFKKISTTNLNEIKKLISYYQVKNIKKNKKDLILYNIFFDKDRIHEFFYQRNILYSDLIDTEIIIFPLLFFEKQMFIYSKNYFYKNWNNQDEKSLIQYILPVENIENIQKIKLNKNRIYKIDLNDFFKEYQNSNMVFVSIDLKEDVAKVFLNTKIENKKMSKNILITKNNSSKEEFNKNIILEIKKELRDLVKSQNLIDVRTPSFLNAKIKLDNKKSNLIEFKERIEKIDLIDNFYVIEFNKDDVLIKIKYLGKIDKIINKLNNQKINLQMKNGQWQLNMI